MEQGCCPPEGHEVSSCCVIQEVLSNSPEEQKGDREDARDTHWERKARAHGWLGDAGDAGQ